MDNPNTILRLHLRDLAPATVTDDGKGERTVHFSRPLDFLRLVIKMSGHCLLQTKTVRVGICMDRDHTLNLEWTDYLKFWPAIDLTVLDEQNLSPAVLALLPEILSHEHYAVQRGEYDAFIDDMTQLALSFAKPGKDAGFSPSFSVNPRKPGDFPSITATRGDIRALTLLFYHFYRPYGWNTCHTGTGKLTHRAVWRKPIVYREVPATEILEAKRRLDRRIAEVLPVVKAELSPRSAVLADIEAAVSKLGVSDSGSATTKE